MSLQQSQSRQALKCAEARLIQIVHDMEVGLQALDGELKIVVGVGHFEVGIEQVLLYVDPEGLVLWRVNCKLRSKHDTEEIAGQSGSVNHHF